MAQRFIDQGKCPNCGSPWEWDYAEQRKLRSCDCAENWKAEGNEYDNRDEYADHDCPD